MSTGSSSGWKADYKNSSGAEDCESRLSGCWSSACFCFDSGSINAQLDDLLSAILELMSLRGAILARAATCRWSVRDAIKRSYVGGALEKPNRFFGTNSLLPFS